MSVKQRLEYGTFFMASRRHQSQNCSGYKYHHDLTYEDAKWILIVLAATPFVAFIFSLFHPDNGNYMDFFSWLFFLIVVDIFFIWQVKHPW